MGLKDMLLGMGVPQDQLGMQRGMFLSQLGSSLLSGFDPRTPGGINMGNIGQGLSGSIQGLVEQSRYQEQQRLAKEKQEALQAYRKEQNEIRGQRVTARQAETDADAASEANTIQRGLEIYNAKNPDNPRDSMEVFEAKQYIDESAKPVKPPKTRRTLAYNKKTGEDNYFELKPGEQLPEGWTARALSRYKAPRDPLAPTPTQWLNQRDRRVDRIIAARRREHGALPQFQQRQNPFDEVALREELETQIEQDMADEKLINPFPAQADPFEGVPSTVVSTIKSIATPDLHPELITLVLELLEAETPLSKVNQAIRARVYGEQ